MPATVIYLICAVAVQPADCTPATARQSIAVPADLASCGMPAMAFPAGLDMLAPGPGEYAKIVCRR